MGLLSPGRPPARHVGGPRRPARAKAIATLAGLLTLLAVSPATAADPWVRQLREPDGLASLPIWGLAQDRAGFVWLGTVGRLYRFDGESLERFAASSLEESPEQLRISPAGVLHLSTRVTWELLRLVEGEVEPVIGPDGGPLVGVRSFEFDHAGRLWVALSNGLWWREPNAGPASWRRIPDLPLTDGTARRLRAAGDALLAATRDEVFRVAIDDEAELLASFPPEEEGIQDVLGLSEGRLVVLRWHDGIDLVHNGEVERFVPVPARGIALVEREGTVWASFDRYLVALRPEGAVEVVDRDAGGFASGGPLLVDHERSLWMGTYRGIVQLPEPDTRIWTERDGLPQAVSRFVTRDESTVWVNTWGGTVSFERSATGDHRLVEPPPEVYGGSNHVCRDRHGNLLAGGVRGILRLRDRSSGTWEPVTADPPRALIGCTPENGALWILSEAGLFHVEGDEVEGSPRAEEALDGPHALPWEHVETAILRDRDGRLWIGSPQGDLCSADERDVLADLGNAWSCESVPGAGYVQDLHQLVDGAIWAASRFQGVLERTNDGWVPLGSSDDAPLPEVTGISASPRGGVWLTGRTQVRRVVRDPSTPRGYRELERLTRWHGLPAPGGQETVEDPDGNVWITTELGVAQVPSSARGKPLVPRVELVEARVGEQRLEASSSPTLSFDRNRPELRFAALSFRDPGLIRYQVRLDERSPWSDAGPSGRFRWVDLPPGGYRAEVRASLDGERWTAEPASFAFRVLPPWYRTRWARALFVLALVSAAIVAYRLRVAHLVALERQRARIATDLHDQMGSGLGSIGVLADLLTDERAHPEDREVAEQIAGTARDLGASLSDIVWALDPGGGSLQEVFARLAERGRGLIAGEGCELVVLPPERWPEGALDAGVRRNVLLVGLEALHNAARHADARRIELSLTNGGGRWRLAVADDGRGMPSENAVRFGHGLPGMRRRAEEIGGEISWRARGEGGTAVELTFAPARGGGS